MFYPLYINHIIAKNKSGEAIGILNRYEEVFAGFKNGNPNFVCDMSRAITFDTLEDAKSQAFLLERFPPCE
jgi:hypothetical protein